MWWKSLGLRCVYNIWSYAFPVIIIHNIFSQYVDVSFSSIPLISWTNTISLFEWKFPCHNSMQILFMYLLLSGCLVPATRRRCGDRGDIAWLWSIYMVISGSLGNCTGDRCVIYGCTQSLPSNYCVLAFICFQSSIVVWNVFQLIVYIISFKGGGVL